MAQFARPISDLDNTGVWTTEPLWSKLDEGAPGGGDTIESDASPVSSETFVVDLSTIFDPETSTNHILRARWAKTAAGGAAYDFTAELRQGYVSEGTPGTLIATLVVRDLSSATLQTDTYTLSSAEADSITDYSDLSIRVFASKSGGGANSSVVVDLVEFEVPDANTFTQSGFRGYEDDAGEGSATPKAAENTDWNQAPDENFRVRFVVEKTGGFGTFDFRLQRNYNAGGWVTVGASTSEVRAVASPHVTDGEATTRQLTSGSGTFTAGKIDEADGEVTGVGMSGGQLTEVEYVIEIVGADVSHNDTIQLRAIEESGAQEPFDVYDQTATLTVDSAVTEQVSVSDGLVLGDTATGTVLTVESGAASDGLVFGEDIKTVTDEAFEADGLVFGDTVSTDAKVSPSDGLVFGDTVSERVDAAGSLADGLVFGDTVSDRVDASEPLSDGLVFGDTASGTSQTAASGTASDGLVLGDSVSERLDLVGTPSDGLVFGDTVTGDAAGTAEGTAQDGLVFGEDIKTVTDEAFEADGLVFGDTAAGSSTTVETASVSEGIEFGEALATVTTVLFDDDGLVFGDAVAEQIAVRLSLSDGLVFGDTAAGASTAIETVAVQDGLLFGETLAGRLDLVAAVADGLELGDDAQDRVDATEALSDGLVFGEVLEGTAAGLAEGIASDGLVFGDSPDARVDVGASLADGLELGDSLSSKIGTALADGFEFGDQLSANEIATLALSDGLIFGDTAFASEPGVGAASDGLVFGDTADPVVAAIGALSDGLVIGDVAESIATTLESLSDGIVFAEQVAGQIAVGGDGGAEPLHCPGDGSVYAHTPHANILNLQSASWDQKDICVLVEPDSIVPTAFGMLVCKQDSGGNLDYYFAHRDAADANLRFFYVGTVSGGANSNAEFPDTGGPIWLRLQYRRPTSLDVCFYYSTDFDPGDPEDPNSDYSDWTGTWTLIGTCPGLNNGTSVTQADASLFIGANSTEGQGFKGDIHRVSIFSRHTTGVGVGTDGRWEFDADFVFGQYQSTTELVEPRNGAIVTIVGQEQSLPDKPTITLVDPIYEDGAEVHTSAFSHIDSGATHRASRYKVYRLDTGALVWDSGYTTDDLTEHLVLFLSPSTGYEVKALHQDDDLVNSPYSDRFAFTTAEEGAGTAPVPPGLFDPANWFLGWQVSPNKFGHDGGWLRPSNADELYHGKVIQYSRYMPYPAALLNNTLGPLQGYRVSGNVMIWGCECVWWPWGFFDTELAFGGVCALASGRIELDDPSRVWAVHLTGDASYTGPPINGVFASIRTGIVKQFGGCGELGTTAGEFRVEAWYDGRVRASWGIAIPLKVVVRSCNQYPYYHIVLDVQRDFEADPTGRTHRIRAAVGTGFNAVDPELTGWDIDETWVGGLEESEPGAGDGGLPCGWAGWAGSRYTGGIATNLNGWTFFDGFTVSGYGDTLACEPGDEPEVPEENPEEDPVPPIAPKPCPPEEITRALDLYLGEKAGAGVFQYGGSELDDDGQVVARIQTNPFVPAGWGGEALIKNIYLSFTHRGDVTLSVVPIVNGELLEAEAKNIFEIGSGSDSGPVRKELALSRPHDRDDAERLRYGIRCQGFAVQLRILDICGSGLTLDGIEIEWEPVRERHPRPVFTEELLAEPFYVPPTVLFLGEKGGARIAGDADIATDMGQSFGHRALSNWIAPAGAGGEVEFRQVYVTLTRANADPLPIELTPQVDGETLATTSKTLPAVTRPVTDVHEFPVTVPYIRPGESTERMRHHPRGAWLRVLLEAPVADHGMVMEGLELEYDVVRESLPAHPRGGSSG